MSENVTTADRIIRNDYRAMLRTLKHESQADRVKMGRPLVMFVVCENGQNTVVRPDVNAQTCARDLLRDAIFTYFQCDGDVDKDVFALCPKAQEIGGCSDAVEVFEEEKARETE